LISDRFRLSYEALKQRRFAPAKGCRMKLAFSTVGCPTWDLPTVAAKAKELGYDGVELRGLTGRMYLPLCPELAGDPAATRGLFEEHGVELVCLSSSAAFHFRDRQVVEENKAEARDYIELAGRLGCPYVRVFGAEIPRRRFFGYEPREVVILRIAAALHDLSPFALEHRVTLLIENSGDFVDSKAVWFLADAVNTPAVQVCWAPFAAMTRGEPPSISIPRLGRKIHLLHLCDGKFDGNGSVESIVPPGKGDLDVPRVIELLKGIAYDGYVVFDWPKLWDSTLAEPDKVFPEAQKYLRDLLDRKPVPLTAYKGDKNAPRFAQRRGQGAALASTTH
jgi:sugar phosphate isomerase/epimerase